MSEHRPKKASAPSADALVAARAWEILAESMRDIAWLMDMSFRTTWATPSATRLRGFTLEELAELPLEEQFTAESLVRVRSLIGEHLTPEKLGDPTQEISESTLLEFRCKDGSTFWGDTIVSVVRDDRGRPMGMSGVIRDVSNRVRMEGDLRESKRRMETLLSNLPGMAYRRGFDRDWSLEFASDGCRALTGHSPQELVDSERTLFAGLINPGDRDRVWQDVQRAASRGDHFSADYRIMAADGCERWVRERGIAVRDAGGEVTAVEGVVEEITPLVEAELALRRSEAQHREMLDRLPIQTTTWRMVGDEYVLEDANEAARVATDGWIAKQFGVTAREHYGDVPEVENQMRLCVKSGEVVQHELDCQLRSTGKVHRLVLTFSYLPPDLVLVHSDDVTHERETEATLAVSQRMEAIGQLAGGVAHDFNNLLTVINSYALFAMEALPAQDPVRADVAEIRRAGARAATLTRQLLAFSRRQVLQPEKLSLNQVVGELEKMLRRLIGEDIELWVRLSDSLGVVEADPGQMEQVIMNIAVNARDAMPQGGKLTIETANVVLDHAFTARHVSFEPGPYVLLSISDNGHGMDVATRDRIFEPFFTTKDKGRGTGLGLATVYGIIRQSAGSILVYSEPAVGTTFKVYLPRLEHVTAEPRNSTSTKRLTGGETLLVVEDEETVRAVTERMLEAAGYTVLTAGSGEEALGILETHRGRIHLLVTDVVMPQMSGKQLADELATQYPQLKVLFMSGYSDEAVIHHGVLSREARFISKPFTIGAITRMVREVLDAPSAG